MTSFYGEIPKIQSKHDNYKIANAKNFRDVDHGWAFGQNFFLCPTDGRAEVQNFSLVRPKAEPNCPIVRKSLGSALGSAPEHFFGQIRTSDSRAPETFGALF